MPGIHLANGIHDIVIIGSGNVAYHLIKMIRGAGLDVAQVLARNQATAGRLSKEFSVPFVLNASQMIKGADIYFLAVQDDRIRDTAMSLDLQEEFLVHLSGFTPLSALERSSANTGVMWPLQSLTAGRDVGYGEIPFFLEANTPENEIKLKELTRRISGNIYITDSLARQKVHLAAVIASNLTNHLFDVSASILQEVEIPFEALRPIIMETALKASATHPHAAQTGPAARGDRRVIGKHLELLGGDPKSREIYRLISENIKNYQKNHEQL